MRGLHRPYFRFLGMFRGGEGTGFPSGPAPLFSDFASLGTSWRGQAQATYGGRSQDCGRGAGSREEQRDRLESLATVASERADPGDYLRTQARPLADLARTGIRLGHDQKSTHLAELSVNGATETVIVRDIQWDHLGKEIIHLDFARVNADESIETEVKLELRGTSPGVSEGGVLEQPVHAVEVTCRANAIPDSIRVDVSNLHLGQSIHVRDLILPEGVKVNAEPELTLVHVVSRSAQAETSTPGDGESLTQPEVIKPERREKDE